MVKLAAESEVTIVFKTTSGPDVAVGSYKPLRLTTESLNALI